MHCFHVARDRLFASSGTSFAAFMVIPLAPDRLHTPLLVLSLSLRPAYSTILFTHISQYLTDDLHITSFAVPPRPTTQRLGFYAGCTRDDLMSILYPQGREATTSALPSVPTPNGAKPRRKKLSALVKSVSGLFRKSEKNKLKGPNTLVAESISSTTELRTAELMFDASEELDGGEHQASAELRGGSESADTLNELIDAHSESDLGSRFGSSDSIAWSLFPRFPDPPVGLTAPVPFTGRPNRPMTGTEDAVSGSASTIASSDLQGFSTDTRTKRTKLPSV